jgi:hypothetical protein
MSNKRFVPSEHCWVKQGNVERVGKELITIENEYGDVTPKNVIRWAKSHSEKHSAIRREMTMDDVKAARKWRKEEARKIIRSVNVKVETPDGAERKANYYQNVEVNVSDGEGEDGDSKKRVYKSVDEIKNNEDQKQQVIDDHRERFRRLWSKFKATKAAIEKHGAENLRRILEIGNEMFE